MGESTAGENATETKRVQFYKFFLIATILNNLGLAFMCFTQGGGPMLVAAPTWLAPTLGALGALTVVSAVVALPGRKLGALGVIVAGTVAALAALVGAVPGLAVMFLLGTGLWAFIARRNWYRLV